MVRAIDHHTMNLPSGLLILQIQFALLKIKKWSMLLLTRRMKVKMTDVNEGIKNCIDKT